MAGIVFTLCVWLSVCLLSCVSSSNVVPDTPTVWTTTKAVFSAALCLFANRFCQYNSSVTMQATVTKLWWLVNLLNSYSIHRQCYIFWAVWSAKVKMIFCRKKCVYFVQTCYALPSAEVSALTFFKWIKKTQRGKPRSLAIVCGEQRRKHLETATKEKSMLDTYRYT